MSINRTLTEEELLLLELAELEIAPPKRKASRKIKSYDEYKSSVYNYVQICIPKQHTNASWKAKSLPGTLVYLHYVDWMNLCHPHISKHTYNQFRDELLMYVNHYFDDNSQLYYFLITNSAQYKIYKHHPYVKMLMEKDRKANLKVKKNTYQRKKREKREAWLKKLQYK